MIKPHVFREYDIRGVAGTDLDAEGYHLLGLALGTYLASHGDRTIVVGRDMRPTSAPFSSALRRGLVETGRRVIDLGFVTTPMAVFGLNFLGADASAAVTASHNPAEYNGLKVRRRTPIFGQELQVLRRLAEAGKFTSGRGSEETCDVREAYLAANVGRMRPERALKVAVDCGNGAGGLVAQDLLERLGFDVVPLYCDPDGSFPNHHPDPTVPENLADLRELVLSERADCGVAFDGDADRMALVDEHGAIHWPDRVLMLMAQRMLVTRPGGVVVCDVKCSRGVAEVVAKAGGTSRMVKTGYPFLLEAMADPKAVVGAELSGHVYFGGDPLFNFDDGVHAACRVLDILSRDARPVSEQLAALPRSVSTPELHATVPEERKFQVVAELVSAFREDGDVVALLDVDGARVSYPEGWGLVRASNTQPKLVLVFEASDEAGLRSVQRRFVAKLARHPEVVHGLG